MPYAVSSKQLLVIMIVASHSLECSPPRLAVDNHTPDGTAEAHMNLKLIYSWWRTNALLSVASAVSGK